MADTIHRSARGVDTPESTKHNPSKQKNKAVMATFLHGGATTVVSNVAAHGMGLVHFPTTLTASQLKAKLPEVEWQVAPSRAR